MLPFPFWRRKVKSFLMKKMVEVSGYRGLELMRIIFLAFFLNTFRCSSGKLVCKISKSMSLLLSSISSSISGEILHNYPLIPSPHML